MNTFKYAISDDPAMINYALIRLLQYLEDEFVFYIINNIIKYQNISSNDKIRSINQCFQFYILLYKIIIYISNEDRNEDLIIVSIDRLKYEMNHSDDKNSLYQTLMHTYDIEKKENTFGIIAQKLVDTFLPGIRKNDDPDITDPISE